MSGLEQQLSRLEHAGLIRLGQVAPELEYLFRHALVQDAAYASLLRADRREMHQAVGEALEGLYANRLAEIAPHLGHHFAEAGDDRRAIAYYTQAADRARAAYATAEAVDLYGRAIASAGRAGLPTGPLLRARGQVHETLGAYEAARADFEAAVQAAVTAGDRQAECETLLDLGMLWSGRDYRRASELYRRAQAAAEALTDRAVAARTLNRVGNWYVNVDQPREAQQYHESALAICRELGDERGVAETLDFLGMALMLGSDFERGMAVYQEAAGLLEAQDQRHALASTLTCLVLAGSTYQSAEMAFRPGPAADTFAAADRAVELTRRTGWRAGEAFAMFALGSALGARGRFGEALATTRSALAISDAIEHLQWQTYGHWLLCALDLDLLALDQARETGERGLCLAREVGSIHWLRNVGAVLAATAVAQGDLARAEAVLDEVAPVGTPVLSMGQRMCWHSRARLALARGEAELALRLTDELVAAAPGTDPRPLMPRVEHTRGLALLALGHADAARAAWHAAVRTAETHGERAIAWRLHADLAGLARQAGHAEAARWHAAIARTTVNDLVASLPESPARVAFQAAAARLL